MAGTREVHSGSRPSTSLVPPLRGGIEQKTREEEQRAGEKNSPAQDAYEATSVRVRPGPASS